VLVAGATGYVGGRLVPRLLERGLSVRCLARRPEFARGRLAGPAEVVAGDVLDPESLEGALAGMEVAYYLVHSMASTRREGFEELDRRGAENFAAAAARAGVRRIVYLGGLGDESDELSAHLRSRHEVGRVLRASGVPVVELRASIVIGSGSLSFEMLRSLVDRLPVMVTPRWVDVKAQPIAIDDLLAYLVAALDVPGEASRIYEIGGSERVSYGDLMREYARQRGLRRAMVSVPVLTPRLSSLWLGLVTPLYARVGRALIDSICHETVVRDAGATKDFAIGCMGPREAIARALAHEDRRSAATRWSDAISAGGTDPRVFSDAVVDARGRLRDTREREVAAPPEAAFAPIRCIGGETGWYAFDWLWRLRGFFDLLVGGVGVRRGRSDPEELRVGDALDWWRVESFAAGRLLRLRAEMKLPGRAWLEFEVTPTPGGSRVRQTATFDPDGAWGRLYWFVIYPLHTAVFRGMLAGIARAAERQEEERA
jgi:uncharacterized protein YbjT (DUF2867 family)